VRWYIGMSSTASPYYRCETCGRSFETLPELEQHKRQEHQKWSRPVTHCVWSLLAKSETS